MITPYYTYSPATKRLSRSDDPAKIDGRMVVHPTPAMYAKIGAYPLAPDSPEPPEPPEGKIAVPDGYELQSGAWVRTYRYEDAPMPAPKVYSTSDAIYALMTRGVYETCRQWMEEQGLRDLVLATKEFTSDMEAFDTIKNGLQQLLGYTDEQVAEVLAEAEVG